MAVLLDSSAILAAADQSDLNHRAALAWFGRVSEPLMIGALTLGEVDLLLQRELGLRATLALLESIAERRGAGRGPDSGGSDTGRGAAARDDGVPAPPDRRRSGRHGRAAGHHPRCRLRPPADRHLPDPSTFARWTWSPDAPRRRESRGSGQAGSRS